MTHPPSREKDIPIPEDEQDLPPSYEAAIGAQSYNSHQTIQVQHAAPSHNLTSPTTSFTRGNMYEGQQGPEPARSSAEPKKGTKGILPTLAKSVDTMIRERHHTTRNPGLLSSIYVRAAELIEASKAGPSTSRDDRHHPSRGIGQPPVFDPRNSNGCCDQTDGCRRCRREQRREQRIEKRRSHRDW